MVRDGAGKRIAEPFVEAAGLKAEGVKPCADAATRTALLLGLRNQL
jgi:hypothetical protein